MISSDSLENIILVSITGTILVVYALLYLCLDMMED